MFVSYPFGSGDDNQAAQLYMVGEIREGNLLVGNLRYNTGYAYLMAPVYTIAEPLGRYDDRLVLAIQVALASLIPFLIYDALRRQRLPNEALTVALVVALDPFGWQWAHFALPVWVVALCAVVGLWAFARARTHWRWAIFGAVILGIGVIARINFVPSVAALGLALLTIVGLHWRERLRLFVVLGGISGGMLLLYLGTIQLWSTGTVRPSCIAGPNYIENMLDAISPENGPASERYFDLVAIEPVVEPDFTADVYPLWRISGPWVQPELTEAFLNNPRTDPGRTIVFPGGAVYALGPCPIDDLQREVFFEAVRLYPLRYLRGVAGTFSTTLTQTGFRTLYGSGPVTVDDPLPLGFARVTSRVYDGQIVWVPGTRIYPVLLRILGPIKWLMPIALVWGLFSRGWVYRAAALMLLAYVLRIAAIDVIEARLYAPVYPLYGVLLGGLLWRTIQLIRNYRNSSDA